jgi:SAM-dependent methyltransferase
MNPVKRMLKAVLPARTYEGLKRTAREARIKLIYRGEGLECPFCGEHFKKFMPHGLDVPVLQEHSVVSGGVRATTCPRCGSYDRERLIYLYLLQRTDVFKGGKKLLDIAPADHLAAKLREIPGLDYISGDLFREDVMVKVDVTDIQFPDATFDVVLCNHILEHVPDDRLAMRELYRVLKPGGWAMVLAPYSTTLAATIEDPSVQSSEERLRRFGQDDHVRIYARGDYLARLTESGFDVEVIPFVDELSTTDRAKYALIGERDIIVARRPISA